MKSLELFTGAGGLALGTHNAGFRHVSLLEWNRDACRTLVKNARKKALRGISNWAVEEADIREIDFTRFEGVKLVAGGVPCQPFSIGGKHGAMNDGRDMFPDFVRSVRTLQPDAFIVENVKGLLRSSFNEYFSYVLLQLTYPEVVRKKSESWQSHRSRLEKKKGTGKTTGLQYQVAFKLLNAADYGVPQTRQRVFIVGFKKGLGANWEFPQPTHSKEALIYDQVVSGAYWERHGLRRPRGWSPYSPSAIARVSKETPRLRPWKTIRDATCDLPKPRLRGHGAEEFSNHWVNPGARTYVGHTGSPIDLPSKTLKAGVHGVPGGENMIADHDGSVRYLTIREAARVQTFPDTWEFEGAWSEAMRQLGNAVPVDLAAVVARSVAAVLKNQPGKMPEEIERLQ